MGEITITPFEVRLAAEEVADLRQRLAQTRWPDWLPASGWGYGVDGDYLKGLCAHWQHTFDFDEYVARLNAFPQYLAQVAGEQLHFYHVRSTVPDARPLLLIHGWPGSIVEFLELIQPLVDPVAHGGSTSDAFHVVVPSLPGYGFSGPTRNKGVNAGLASAMINSVMHALGYDRYFAQGGDWGAIIASRIAQDFPDSVAALHLNMAPGGPTNPMLPVEGLDANETAQLDRLRQHLASDSGYSLVQMTRPQTLAVAMNDSPAGLAAWIIDKFWAWTDHGGDLDVAFGRDHLLENLSIYWFTKTAGSSFRLYHESNFLVNYVHAKVAVPTGVAQFAGEPFSWPRKLVEWNYSNLQDWQELPSGGHFAAFQRKDAFLKIVRSFLKTQTL